MPQAAVFWLVITVLFFTLVGFHMYQVFRKLPPLPKRPTIKNISGVPLNISEAVQDMNNVVVRFNHMNKMTNIAQCVGYALASLAALSSFIFSLQNG
jgi:hypothetical protein